MLTRRILLGLAAAATFAAPAFAQSWKAKYPELVFSSRRPKTRPA